ncbi:hypothetical protein EXIGLDRAFT_729443 [Exidia glandulosa HHB12029]|uniref:DUF6533 domain-containing protein n=1 Tax=Exidia glandulosa HHB12029 TaxID=1314781 RepID=A0A165LJE1_EXIGL|nr:hypothetical protein EXIGLDRAFT_729443 [Exidia glandulosa HHB12029]
MFPAAQLADLGLTPATLVTHAFVTRYVTMAAYTALLWDIITQLPSEVERVWLRRGSVARTIYLINRYATLLCLTLQVYGFSALATGSSPNDAFCRSALSLNLVVGTLSLGVGNYLVLLKVWALWDHAPWVVRATTIGWAAAYAATMLIVALTIGHLWTAMISLVPVNFHFCAITSKPDLIRGIWASPLAFEVLVFVFTIWNAADRPRKQGVSMLHMLGQDGVIFFLVRSILRVFNLIATIALPTSLTFIGSSVIWAANTITLGRLIMHWQAALDAQVAHGILGGRGIEHRSEHLQQAYELKTVVVKREVIKHTSVYGTEAVSDVVVR